MVRKFKDTPFYEKTQAHRVSEDELVQSVANLLFRYQDRLKMIIKWGKFDLKSSPFSRGGDIMVIRHSSDCPEEQAPILHCPKKKSANLLLTLKPKSQQ